jgi:hypothetical protein
VSHISDPSPETVLHGEPERQPALLVDAHVHLHDCFPPASFLEHAERNFERAQGQGQADHVPGVLMLTESAGVDWFGRLASVAAGKAGNHSVPLAPWSIEETGDPASLVARNGRRRLYLVAGRQVVAREGLEVLLLGTRAMVPDGRPIREVLAEGERLGALRVIPWGAGKWLFSRARLLSDLLAEVRHDGGFFLGDGAGRPFFWTRPRHFEEAQRRGVRVLPGTDPLPFASEVSRAGSYGFRLDAPVDLARPAEAILAALRDPASRITPFGRHERLTPFVRNQLAMQRLKRRRATA